MNINEWIDPEHLKKIKEYKDEIKNNKPFAHTSIPNFLVEKKANEIYDILVKQNYYLEDHDLYQFLRTVHFKNIKSKEIKEILDSIFSEEFVSFIEKISGCKLSKKQRELHSLNFTNGHYLLCHDDKVQGRKIAFIVNLSKNWTKKDGGELELYYSKKGEPVVENSKIVLPAFNQFNMFIVTDNSFHQVREVLSDKHRISLAGWFYEEDE